MPTPRPRPRYRCRFCGAVFSAWIPVPGEPDGALLLGHIRQSHPGELTPFLEQMHTDDDITPAIVQAFEEVEAPSTPREGQASMAKLGHDRLCWFSRGGQSPTP
jgi:hypothetical protein